MLCWSESEIFTVIDKFEKVLHEAGEIYYWDIQNISLDFEQVFFRPTHRFLIFFNQFILRKAIMLPRCKVIMSLGATGTERKWKDFRRQPNQKKETRNKPLLLFKRWTLACAFQGCLLVLFRLTNPEWNARKYWKNMASLWHIQIVNSTTLVLWVDC